MSHSKKYIKMPRMLSFPAKTRGRIGCYQRISHVAMILGTSLPTGCNDPSLKQRISLCFATVLMYYARSYHILMHVLIRKVNIDSPKGSDFNSHIRRHSQGHYFALKSLFLVMVSLFWLLINADVI